MTKTALITGATGGLGKAFAAVFAKHGYELVLTGRDEKKLEEVKELAKRLGAKALTVAADLTAKEEQDRLFAQTREKGIAVDVLVNNAGFGDFGLFFEGDPEKQAEMVAVNIAALVRLTRLFLPGMIERGGGRVMNLASTAAFQPGPLMACYYATKAFVLSFSEAIALELEGTGVFVTALCPGPTSTGFERRASLTGRSMLFSSLRPARAEDVAEYGFGCLMKGKRVAVHGARNKLMAFFAKIMPRKLVARTVFRIQRRRRPEKRNPA